MKLARFLVNGSYHEGSLIAPDVLCDEAGREYSTDAVSFLPPVEPRTMIGLALNYKDHAQELSVALPAEPALFFKPLNTLVGHRGQVIYPQGIQYMHYENELAVVIGRRCRNVAEAEAFEVIRGYTIANELTIRDFVQNFYRPPVKAKGWDTFCPLGPYLVEGEIEDPHKLELRTYINGELRQCGNTQDMLRPIPALIAYITSFMTLEANDIILTGTPKGVSHIYPGDQMRLEIDGLGVLENTVVAEAATTSGEHI
ncbi:2-hydroxyhepta-2,4-diene-1,7-dioate isomerase [Ktedonosporobacter rubrisoli]|uniref:2-hydroxyhepta-2,4-diene-1,7-dioate isomerase n=1 Tax=Ktedonosporobacter rubrisoli TaxID=2509675 RepID=A0A4P6JP92_KTERU|nr:fumarylacetoacetate hydrolase family protein [Ktedonosporobacter rubrisoli]QBD77085.1 2-hydroxyhepta-2,4-diene-1,7-dioate isomerase [Ktedonosporobacter rubrisoli]